MASRLSEGACQYPTIEDDRAIYSYLIEFYIAVYLEKNIELMYAVSRWLMSSSSLVVISPDSTRLEDSNEQY